MQDRHRAWADHLPPAVAQHRGGALVDPDHLGVVVEPLLSPRDPRVAEDVEVREDRASRGSGRGHPPSARRPRPASSSAPGTTGRAPSPLPTTRRAPRRPARPRRSPSTRDWREASPPRSPDRRRRCRRGRRRGRLGDHSGRVRVLLAADAQLAHLQSQAAEPVAGRFHRSRREVLCSRRDHIGRSPGARVAKNFVLVLVAWVELVAADEGEWTVHPDHSLRSSGERGVASASPYTLTAHDRSGEVRLGNRRLTSRPGTGSLDHPDSRRCRASVPPRSVRDARPPA